MDSKATRIVHIDKINNNGALQLGFILLCKLLRRILLLQGTTHVQILSYSITFKVERKLNPKVNNTNSTI